MLYWGSIQSHVDSIITMMFMKRLHALYILFKIRMRWRRVKFIPFGGFGHFWWHRLQSKLLEWHGYWYSVEYIPLPRPNSPLTFNEVALDFSPLMKPHLYSLNSDYYLDLHQIAHTFKNTLCHNVKEGENNFCICPAIRIHTKNDHIPHPTTEYCGNLSNCFCVMLLNNRKNKRNENIISLS